MISNRMCRGIVAFSTVALFCGATAFAQSTMNPNQNGQSTNQNGQSTMGSNPNASSMPPMSNGQASMADKKFTKKAIQGNMAEIQLGQLAAENGGSADVKNFGQKMVTDHTQMNDQLKPIAEQIGVQVPAMLSPKAQALKTKLQGESGQQFDKTYIKAMLKDHHKDLMEFRKEARNAKDPSLKQCAMKGEQVIEQHLDDAQQLAQAHNVSMPGSMNKMNNSSAGSPSGSSQ